MDVLLKRKIELGADAENFIQSQLGAAVLEIAQGQANAAYNELARVSPFRRRRIAQLQTQIWRAESMQEWLAAIVTEGRNALEMLQNEE